MILSCRDKGGPRPARRARARRAPAPSPHAPSTPAFPLLLSGALCWILAPGLARAEQAAGTSATPATQPAKTTAGPAGAQPDYVTPTFHPGLQEAASGNQPVTFLADNVSYDRTNGIVSATGHVQAWQNDHYLAADRVTFDRNTGVAAAYGHVVMVEPDGEIIFGDYAEVAQGMRNGIVSGMRALLANGGKLAANGARRIEGKLNEMSRGVYSSCDVCALQPDRPPEWQLRANNMVQDLEHKRIEFSDAWLDIFGFPIAWMPYMSTTDPSVKRQSGFLPPSFGWGSDYLGAFFAQPYFWVLDDQSDVTITPEVSSLQGGEVQADYRRWFNNGRVEIDGAVGHDQGAFGGYVFANANFNYNDTWRYGVSVNLGTSVDYLRDYQNDNAYLGAVLASGAYIEGFGVGSYTKLDVGVWQGLVSSINQSTLPYVLPHYQYSYFSEPDWLGGRWSFDAQAFNVLRMQGSNDRRIAGDLEWDRPFAGLLGEQYLLTVEAAGTLYESNVFGGQPNYGTEANATTVHAQPQVSLLMHWPFVRGGGALGTQLIEPIVQLIAAPQSGNSLHDHLPNEDSLDYEFTDATLFSRNRFGGYDRYDGGMRANFALHGTWTFAGGQVLDGLVGASAIEHVDYNLYPQFQPWNGFNKGSHVSDVVGKLSFTPSKWVDFTTRARVDHASGDVRFFDAITSFGDPHLRFHVGYFYDSTNPYFLYLSDFFTPPFLLAPNNPNQINFFTPRNEVDAGLTAKWGRYSLIADARRNLENGTMDNVDGHVRYEDECTIFDMLFNRRYTSINGDHGDTTVLFTITLKTVGQFNVK